jgi:tetratricopeptide (TPR) repeat protein
MNPSHKRVLLVFLTGVLSSPACGPFFPDTVLDLPQAALRVRGTCLLDEMIAIDRSCGRGLSLRPAGLAMIRRSQHDPSQDGEMSVEELDRMELRQALQAVIAAGMPEELVMSSSFGEGATQAEAIELAVVLLENKIAPPRVLEIVNAFTAWRKSLPEADMNGPWNIAVPTQAEVPVPPDCPEVPRDIVAYWKAARVWRGGDLPAARTAWQAILDLPENNRGNRAVWAAWMLAKTSPDQAAAVPFYQKAVALSESGCRDALGLSALAMGWLAKAENDPVSRLKLYFEAACSGNEDMLVSLRWQLSPILADESAMNRAATDPLAREIVTALSFVMYNDPELPGKPETETKDTWLDLLEKHPSAKPSPSAAKAAWTCYSRADFDAARRWLKHATPDAGEVLWLRAKLALRDGKLNEAARLFAKAAPFYQFAPDGNPPEPMLYEMQWHNHATRRDWMRGQFQSDRAIVHIGRGEFLRAMDFLVKASYNDDAAYLAERVLTTDELVAWVKRNRPAAKTDPSQPVVLFGADGGLRFPEEPWEGDRFRYLLARRLAREFRFREAAEFMPHALRRMFDHYVLMHREAARGSWPDETKAAILWEMASWRRHLGMEFFGYEGAPDNTRWDGNFMGIDYASRRSRKNGWSFKWNDDEDDLAIHTTINGPQKPEDFAVPVVSREEIQRLAPHVRHKEPRFHYRYEAAEIAWRAAKLLPDNDPRTLYVLHEAGRWLANRDPLTADRFYQEIISRCTELPQWRELDRRRWFLPRAPESPPLELPDGLRFSNPDVAANLHSAAGDFR